jgi:hypothetical protein
MFPRNTRQLSVLLDFLCFKHRIHHFLLPVFQLGVLFNRSCSVNLVFQRCRRSFQEYVDMILKACLPDVSLDQNQKMNTKRFVRALRDKWVCLGGCRILL